MHFSLQWSVKCCYRREGGRVDFIYGVVALVVGVLEECEDVLLCMKLFSSCTLSCPSRQRLPAYSGDPSDRQFVSETANCFILAVAQYVK